MPTITYAITAHNEDITSLLDKLMPLVERSTDEILLLIDTDNNHGSWWLDMPQDKLLKIEPSVIYHSLRNDYSAHKNYHIQCCNTDYIYAIDADEIPSLVGEELHELIDNNPATELFWLPRLNYFKGVTPEHAKQYNWTLSEVNNEPVVNWNSGDYQGRIFKRDYPRIHWDGRLHERIIGNNTVAYLPKEEQYALIHRKIIAKQLKDNERYNTLWTKEENQGHVVPLGWLAYHRKPQDG